MLLLLLFSRFEQEIAGNLPPPPKMPKMPPGIMPNFMGGPPQPPSFMNQNQNQKNNGQAPSQMPFPGLPPQMPHNMFGPPMGGMPPPHMQHGLPVPPPMMIPPPMPMPMPMPHMPMPGGNIKLYFLHKHFRNFCTDIYFSDFFWFYFFKFEILCIEPITCLKVRGKTRGLKAKGQRYIE